MARKKKASIVPILSKPRALFQNVQNLIDSSHDGLVVIHFPEDGSPPQHVHNFHASTRIYRREASDYVDLVGDEIREGNEDV